MLTHEYMHTYILTCTDAQNDTHSEINRPTLRPTHKLHRSCSQVDEMALQAPTIFWGQRSRQQQSRKVGWGKDKKRPGWQGYQPELVI